MSKEIEEKLDQIPVINIIVSILRKLKPKILEGLSIYDLAEMYITGIVNGALTYRAGSIAFSFFMALFPSLLFLLNLLPYVPIENFQEEFMNTIVSVLPTETAIFLDGIIADIVRNKRGGLLSSAFFLSIFLMANGVTAIFAGFENSYHTLQKRSFFKQYSYALGVGLILALLLIFTIIVLGFVQLYIVPYFSDIAGRTTALDSVTWEQMGVSIAKYIFLVVIIYIATAILYYYGTHEGREARFFSPGVGLTTILIVITSYLFGIYIANFSQYNELYGSIGTILILMLYIWLNSNILLLGFELNASISMLKRNRELAEEIN